MPDRPWDLFERTARFAEAACSFARQLPKTPEAQEVASQLRRAATGVAANYRAARRGPSEADFIAKIGVVIEDADEAMYWLEHLARARTALPDEIEALRCEANELVAIFTAAHKTAKRNRDAQKERNGLPRRRRRTAE